MLAILAPLAGRALGWVWLDTAMGMAGVPVIARWSLGPIRDADGVLLDCVPEDHGLSAEIRSAIERPGGTVTDLHAWQLGPGHHGTIVVIASAQPQPSSDYRARLAHVRGPSHLTVEVEPAVAHP